MQDGPSLPGSVSSRLDRMLAAGSLCLEHIHALADALDVSDHHPQEPPRCARPQELREQVESLAISLRTEPVLKGEQQRVETLLGLLQAEIVNRHMLIDARAKPNGMSHPVEGPTEAPDSAPTDSSYQPQASQRAPTSETYQATAGSGDEAAMPAPAPYNAVRPSPHLCNWAAQDGTVHPLLHIRPDGIEADPYLRLAAPMAELAIAGRSDLANALYNRVLEARRDYSIAPLMPLFMALRAAAVAPTRANPVAAIDYACNLLSDQRCARLIAIGGLSGSGKSALARALAIHLAPCPGAVWLRTDGIRKRLLGASPEEKLPESGYHPAVSGRVYKRLAEDTRQLLSLGQTVIAEATFTRAPSRAAIAAIATGADCPFHGLWLEAPLDILMERTDARAAEPHTASGSDASPDIVEVQSRDKFGNITWHRVRTDRPFNTVLADVLDLLKLDD